MDKAWTHGHGGHSSLEKPLEYFVDDSFEAFPHCGGDGAPPHVCGISYRKKIGDIPACTKNPHLDDVHHPSIESDEKLVEPFAEDGIGSSLNTTEIPNVHVPYEIDVHLRVVLGWEPHDLHDHAAGNL